MTVIFLWVKQFKDYFSSVRGAACTQKINHWLKGRTKMQLRFAAVQAILYSPQLIYFANSLVFVNFCDYLEMQIYGLD